MEESKKTCNDQEKKKVVIKMGGSGGGGIGAVVLLGGVLATAALASAFVVRGKGRSSGKDRHRRHQSPPPEIKEQSEQDEATEGQETAVTDQSSHLYKHIPSKGEIKQVESDTNTDTLVFEKPPTFQGQKAGIETNGGRPGDVEASDQILCSISPKKLEKDVVSDDGFVLVEEDFPSLDEKLPLKSQNKMPEDEKHEIRLTEEEDVSNDCSKESKNLEQVCNEEERAGRGHTDDGKIEAMSYKEAVEVTEIQQRQDENTQLSCDQEDIEAVVVDDDVVGVCIDQAEDEKKENLEMNMEKEEMEGCCCGNGEISEENCIEAIESVEADLSEDGIGGNQEAVSNDSSRSENVVFEGHSEDGEKTPQPVLESLVIEREDVDGDEKEGSFPTEAVEIVHEDEAIEGSREDHEKHVEVKSVGEQEKCNQPDEGIVQEKSEDVEWIDEAKQSNQLNGLIEEKVEDIFVPDENKEENGCIVHPTPENVLPMLEELITPEDTGVTKEDGANEEVVEGDEVCENKNTTQFDAKKNVEEEVEELIPPEDIETTKDGVNEEVPESLELEELISPENIETTKDGVNEGVPESLELNENETLMQFPDSQPKDQKDDLERDTKNEVEEEMISHENVEATKDETVNEAVVDSAEESENKSSVQFVVGQPKEHEDDFTTNIAKEVEDASEMTKTGIATAKDGLIMERSDDQEKSADKTKDSNDFNDEATFSDEVEESSVGTGDSSTESNWEAVWPAESSDESSMEPQKAKLTSWEFEGKIQEDKAAAKEGKDDSQIICEESSFDPHKENNSVKGSENFPTAADGSRLEKTFIKKYVVELGMLKDHPTNSTRRRMVIGTLSVLSSLSCSWFFGLSFVKLCLVVFLTVVLSEVHGY